MCRKFLLVVFGAITAVTYTFSGDEISSGEFEDGRVSCSDEYKNCDIRIGDLEFTRWLDQTINVSDRKNKAEVTEFISVHGASDDEQSWCAGIRDGKYKMLPVSDCQYLRNYLPAFNKVFNALGSDPSNWIDLYKGHRHKNDKKQSYARVTKTSPDIAKQLMYVTEQSTQSSDKPSESCYRGFWIDEQLPVDECASLRKYVRDFENLGQELAQIKSQQKRQS